jgi:RNA polymerase sigma-70 factor (ECF subfamily)
LCSKGARWPRSYENRSGVAATRKLVRSCVLATFNRVSHVSDSITPDPIEQLSQVARDERTALVAVALREGLRAEEALECVQDALCTWLARSQREPSLVHPLLVASLKRMVQNAARNQRRRHYRLKPHRPIDETALAAEGGDAEQLLDDAESALRLHTCVAELRDVERAVVTLRLLEERSGEDVAQALGLSRAHVDVLVHRAKLTLRTCMRAGDCSAL